MRNFPQSVAHHLLDQCSDIIILLDKNLNVIYTNKKIKLLGLSDNALYSRTLYKLLSSSGRAVLQKKINQKKDKFSIKTKLHLPHSAEVDAELWIERQKIANQVYILVTVNPVKWKDSPSAIVDMIETGLILSNKTGTIKFLNYYVKELFGDRELMHLSNLPYNLGNVLLDAIKQNMQRGEIELRKGKYLGYNFKPFPLDDEEHYLFQLKDITERKLMERAMEEFDRVSSLDSLASGLAHEIKNPLAGMKLMAQRLDKDLEEDGEEKKREYIRRIIKQIDRIDHLIKTLFSQVKAHTVQIEKINVYKLIKEVKEILENQIIKNGISFKNDVSRDIGVAGDNSQLQTIFINLILNAIEALKDYKGERRISVSAKESNLKCPICGVNYISVDVTDTGPGIKKEAIDKLFYPFFTTRAEGTGLGLFLVHKLVKENRGLINVRSEEEKGTVFSIYLHPASAVGAGCFRKL